jgi:hypothetical protein
MLVDVVHDLLHASTGKGSVEHKEPTQQTTIQEDIFLILKKGTPITTLSTNYQLLSLLIIIVKQTF